MTFMNSRKVLSQSSTTKNFMMFNPVYLTMHSFKNDITVSIQDSDINPNSKTVFFVLSNREILVQIQNELQRKMWCSRRYCKLSKGSLKWFV